MTACLVSVSLNSMVGVIPVLYGSISSWSGISHASLGSTVKIDTLTHSHHNIPPLNLSKGRLQCGCSYFICYFVYVQYRYSCICVYSCSSEIAGRIIMMLGIKLGQFLGWMNVQDFQPIAFAVESGSVLVSYVCKNG